MEKMKMKKNNFMLALFIFCTSLSFSTQARTIVLKPVDLYSVYFDFGVHRPEQYFSHYTADNISRIWNHYHGDSGTLFAKFDLSQVSKQASGRLTFDFFSTVGLFKWNDALHVSIIKTDHTSPRTLIEQFELKNFNAGTGGTLTIDMPMIGGLPSLNIRFAHNFNNTSTTISINNIRLIIDEPEVSP
jgi:hypothetical protein